ncbi:transcriptional regulator [Microdochium nivale]|nr:transcriptional regulator [Microdochium nivale]
MYINTSHGESNISALRQLIRENPLGVLTTGILSATHPFLQSSHIPFLLDAGDDSSETALGVLRGHLARQNPQSKAIIENLKSSSSAAAEPAPPAFLEHEVLVLFTAEAHHYITPKFYTTTKPATEKVVPTWNYAAAQAYGRARVYYDSKAAETGEFLARAVRDLTDQCEGGVMGYSTGGAGAGEDGKEKAWKVDDAPDAYVKILQKNIIGIEIEITRLEGKFKMSQEMSKGDMVGVAEGLEKFGTPASVGVAAMVCTRTPDR